MNTRDTSLESFEQIRQHFSTQQAALVGILQQYGRCDWSLQEISSATGFDIRTSSRIVYDLKHLGAMFELRKRYCSITNRSIHAVVLRSFYGQEFETQRRERAAQLTAALSDEAQRCDCVCCQRWIDRLKREVQQVQRAANPT